MNMTFMKMIVFSFSSTFNRNSKAIIYPTLIYRRGRMEGGAVCKNKFRATINFTKMVNTVLKSDYKPV